jgi:hypothetical protein
MASSVSKPEISIKSPDRADFVASFSDGILKGFFVILIVSIASWVVNAVLRGDSSDSTLGFFGSRATPASNANLESRTAGGGLPPSIAARNHYLRNVHTLGSISTFN